MAKKLFNKSKKQKLPVSDTISEEFIKQLLLRQEGVNLDFKRDMYKISFKDYKDEYNNLDDKVKKEQIKQDIKQQKGELIKDILSLANRNIANVADTSYLIVGAANQQDENGNRKLFNITYEIPESKDLLQLVNSHCEPSIDNIFCETISLYGNTLWIITIPPTRFLHETTRELWCKTVQGAAKSTNCDNENEKPRYSIRTAFIRNGECIQIATMKERTAIEKAKEKNFQKENSLSPTIIGIILGIMIGSPFVATNAKNVGLSPMFGFILGMIIIGLFGGIMGSNINQIQEIILSFNLYSIYKRIIFVILLVFLFAGIVIIYGRIALGY